MGILGFAKKANKLRKIVKKFNKLFKRTKQVKKQSTEIPKKVEKETNKQVKEFEKDMNDSVKDSTKSIEKNAKKDGKKSSKQSKKDSKGVLDSLTKSIKSMLGTVVKKLKSIKTFVKKLPAKIATLMFSPFKHVTRHINMEKGKTIVFGSAFIAVILATFSDSVAYIMNLHGNLIITGIFNFITIFILTFLSFMMKIKYSCKIKSMSRLVKKMPIVKLLKISATTAGVTIVTSYQIFGSIFRVLNAILENMGETVQKIAAIKESLVIGGVYLMTSIMTPIPTC